MNEPEPLTAGELRDHRDLGPAQARARYLDHLRGVLSQRGVDDAAAVAEIAIQALTEWRDIDSGELCRCSCHPRLPVGDLHDYGFDCNCTRTDEQRRRAFQQALADIREQGNSPAGQQARAEMEAEEAALQAWLSQASGVVVHSHDGWAPEQWIGEVDGHSFRFRERDQAWHIEIDLRPTGRTLRAVDGRNEDGTTRYRQHALEQGEVIATGTVDADRYGNSPVERAQFIVTAIRDHLTRKACTHCSSHGQAFATVLGGHARWCPDCGIRLSLE